MKAMRYPQSLKPLNRDEVVHLWDGSNSRIRGVIAELSQCLVHRA
jgi:hypothetical protein